MLLLGPALLEARKAGAPALADALDLGRVRTHVGTLSGNPYDGRTLASVIPDMEALVANSLERILADAGLAWPQRPARL